MPLDLPQGSELYADAGYTDCELEDLLGQLEGVRLLACRRRNAKRAHQPYQAYLKQHYRKRIETTFSQITGFFPKKLHAVTAEGFILKLILLIFAFTLSQVA